MRSGASQPTKQEQYVEALQSIQAALVDEDDWVSAMATVVCELHHRFDHFHWTGFYRVAAPGLLKIGPYQGGHGCIEIDFDRGVCGAAARERRTQLIPDVHAFEGHIACSSSSQSEIVVPVITPEGELLAVLDVDSDLLAAFDEIDQEHLEGLCGWLGSRWKRP